MTSDDELAAVLGHEMSHVIGEHLMEEFYTGTMQAFTMIPVLPMLVGAFFARRVALIAFTSVAANLFLWLYLQRCREQEADYIGMLLMAEAGFNPAAATAAFNKFAAFRDNTGAPLWQPIDILSTHPSVSSTPVVMPHY